jgi:hypothetical protein
MLKYKIILISDKLRKDYEIFYLTRTITISKNFVDIIAVVEIK